MQTVNQTNHQHFLKTINSNKFDWDNIPVFIYKKALIKRLPYKKEIKYDSEAFLTLDHSYKVNLEFSIEKTLQVFDNFFAASVIKAVDDRLLQDAPCYWTLKLKEAGAHDLESETGLFYILETLKLFQFYLLESLLPSSMINDIMETVFQKAAQTGSIFQFFANVDHPLKALKLLMDLPSFKKDVLIPFWIKMIEHLVYDWEMEIKFNGPYSRAGLDKIIINLDGLNDIIKVEKIVEIFEKNLGFKKVKIQD